MKKHSALNCCILLFTITAFGETVNVRDFGAVGDAQTDDTEAIRMALEASPNVYFPAGVYLLTDGIRLPDGAKITGAGAPRLGTFPMIEDDKRFFREGMKAKLSGTTLLFANAGQQSATLTNRNDTFRTLRYAIATAPQSPFSIEGMAIALDVNVLDSSGRPTELQADQRADYDVGLFIDDAGFSTVSNVCIYGFYKKAGLLVSTRGVGGNPDYNTFWNCSFMGNVGVALLGDDAPSDKLTYGLSGTQFYGCNFYAMDHHYRSAAEFGQTAILIDGHTNAKSADINGHYFFGGSVRTYSPNAVTLKAASNVAFFGTVFELPKSKWGDINYGKTDNRISGTEDTRDVSFYSCRMHSKGLDELGRSMKEGRLFVSQGHYGDIAVHANGTVARIYANQNGRAIIQLSDNSNTAFSGWNFDFSAKKRDQLAIRFDNKDVARFEASGRLVVDSIQTKSIENAQSSEVIPTLGQTQITELNNAKIVIDSAVVEINNQANESALASIQGGIENQLLILRKGSLGRSFTITSDGNIRLESRFHMQNEGYRLTLLKNGDEWYEISRIGGY